MSANASPSADLLSELVLTQNTEPIILRDVCERLLGATGVYHPSADSDYVERHPCPRCQVQLQLRHLPNWPVHQDPPQAKLPRVAQQLASLTGVAGIANQAALPCTSGLVR